MTHTMEAGYFPLHSSPLHSSPIMLVVYVFASYREAPSGAESGGKMEYQRITKWIKMQPDNKDKWKCVKCLVDEIRHQWQPHDEATWEWLKTVVVQMSQNNHEKTFLLICQLLKEKLVLATTHHCNDMLVIVLNAYLAKLPELPVDPITYSEFIRKTNPKMLHTTENIKAIQTVHMIWHMYKICNDLCTISSYGRKLPIQRLNRYDQMMTSVTYPSKAAFVEKTSLYCFINKSMN